MKIHLTIPNNCPDSECPCEWRGYVQGRIAGHAGRGAQLRYQMIQGGKLNEMWTSLEDVRAYQRARYQREEAS